MYTVQVDMRARFQRDLRSKIIDYIAYIDYMGARRCMGDAMRAP